MSAKLFTYTDGPESKPNATHLVTILRQSDMANFVVVALPNGTQHVVHRSKLKRVEQEQAEGGA